MADNAAVSGPPEHSQLQHGDASTTNWPGDALAAIARANSTDLVRLVTAIRRGDRFSEGNIAGAIESGIVAAISRRAAALIDS